MEEAELELAFNNRSVSEEVKAHFTSDTVSKEAVWVYYSTHTAVATSDTPYMFSCMFAHN